jgi:PAS domain S-box-containing protein
MNAHRAINGWLSAMLLLVLPGIAVIFWTFGQMQDTAQGRRISGEQETHATQFLSNLNNAESGQRGYILTGEAAYLLQYQTARDTLPQSLAQLSGSMTTSAAQQRLDASAPLLQATLKELDRSINLRRSNDTIGAVALVGSGEEMKLMDALQREMADFLVIEGETHSRFDAAYKTNLRNMYLGIVAESALALLYALYVAFSIARNERQRLSQMLHMETEHRLKVQIASNAQLQQSNITLRHSESKLAVTLSSIGDAVIATDAHARITLINPVAQRLTGWTEDEAQGRTMEDLFHLVQKHTRAVVFNPVEAVLRTGVPQALTNHTVLIRQDGREFDIADSCAPIRDPNDQVVGAVLVFRDVTKEHVAQQALHDSSALLQTIFNTVADGIVTVHAEGSRIESVNRAIETMFGYSAAELNGLSLGLLLPELDQALHNWSLSHYAAVEVTRVDGMGREVIGRRKNGTTFSLEITVSDMVLRGQHYFTGILRDITPRKQAEEALFKADALQSAIFNSANFSSIATDAKGVIQIFNVGAERMLGYAAIDVLNQITPADISDPQEVVVRARALSAELDTLIAPGFDALVFKASRGIEDIYELTYIRKDGSRFPAVVSVTALRDATDAIIGYLLIGTDNTARKAVDAERMRLDQVLQDKNAELQMARVEADKANQAKSDFLSSMSHELRSPLNAILGFAQLMETGLPLPTTPQMASINHILRAGWYLLDLINEVLDLSLIESGKLSLSIEPISLPEILADCHSLIQPLADKQGISLNFPVIHGVPFVAGDRTRVKQVLINLLSNAIKYNREGGNVQVSCNEKPNAILRICVRDSGNGLSPDMIAQLFQPFNRLGQEASAGEGTGIGLVVSKRLMQLMGGEIGMSSSVGVGSMFWIELTLTATPQLMHNSPQPSAVRTALGPMDGDQRTLLYVEDNQANMDLAEQLIARRPDMRLLGAGDGMHGVLMARQHLPNLILMDINLPGISGLQALRMLREDPRTRHIPVLALSANALPRDIERGLEAGFFRYLTKPVRVAEFMEALDMGLVLADEVSRAQ